MLIFGLGELFSMSISLELSTRLGTNWITVIYREKIRSLRTRSYQLNIPKRENPVDIQHTLLGVELKTVNVRLACPDLATARYLKVFARFGCQEVAIPYDITKISTLADELESSWQQTLLHFERITAGKTPHAVARSRSLLIKAIRSEIEEIGAGERIPQFNQSTKQRV